MLFIAFLVALAVAGSGLVSAREVFVDVSAPWPVYGTETLVEVGEMVSSTLTESGAVEGESFKTNIAYWKYLKGLCAQHTTIDAALSPLDRQTLDQIAFTAAQGIISPALYPLTETMVKLGQYSASSPFFQSLSPAGGGEDPCSNSSAFVVTSGKEDSIRCDPSAPYPASGEGVNHGSDEWDHTLIGKEGGAHYTLYGTPGTSSFCAHLTSLTTALNNGEASSVSIRPSFHGLTQISKDRSLQGYGVFLDIKNMEYKNVDDSADAAAAKAAADSDAEIKFNENEEVLGVNFAKLLKHHPESAKEIRMLREELIEKDGGTTGSGEKDGGLKVWKLKDLGLQTLQMFSSKAIKENTRYALDWLAEVVENFPKYAPQISSTKVSSQTRQDLTMFFQAQVQQMMPMNAIFLNGKSIDLDSSTFNLFDLLQEISKEFLSRETNFNLLKEGLSLVHSHTNSLGRSESTGLSLNREVEETLHELDKISSIAGISDDPIEQQLGGGPAVRRVDVSKGGKHCVTFANNLEKDPLYKQAGWPKTLKTLLYPSWSLHTIARNLYTLVIVADPLTIEGASMISESQMMLMQQFPVRIGYVFPCTGSNGLGEDYCRIFAYLRDKGSVADAIEFSFAVSQFVTASERHGDSLRDTLSRDLLISLATEASSQAKETSRSLYFSSVKATGPPIREKALRTDVFADSQSLSRYGLDYVTNSTAFLDARNLPVNSFSLNGIVSMPEGGEMQQTLMQLLGREQFILSHYVRSGLVTEKSKSLFNDILSNSKSYPRFHSMLDERTSPAQYANMQTNQARELFDSRIGFVSPYLSTDLTAEGLREYVSASNTLTVVVPATKSSLQSVIAILRVILDDSRDKLVGGERRTRLGVVYQPPLYEADSTCTDSNSDICTDTMSSEDIAVLSALSSALSAHSEYSMSSTCIHVLLSTYQDIVKGISARESLTNSLTNSYIDTAGVEDSTPYMMIRAILDAIDQPNGVTNAITSAWETYRQAVEVLSYTSDSTVSLSLDSVRMPMSEAIVSYNSRVIRLSLSHDKPLHPLDIRLLQDLEDERLSRKVGTRVLQDIETKSLSLALSNTSNKPILPILRGLHSATSTLYQSLISHTGRQSSLISGNTRRFDVDDILQSLFFSQGNEMSSMVHTLLPSDSMTTNMSGDRYLRIYAVIDPLTIAGQRGISIVKLLSETLSVTLSLLLVPRLEVTEFPLQSFYRFVADGTLGEHGGESVGALFQSLPRQHTLTVRLDVPEPWNVQSSHSKQDVDNLRCSRQVCGDVPNDPNEATFIGYGLRDIMVAGQCFQITADMADRGSASLGSHLPSPNGLQLTLQSLVYGNNAVYESDTVVMQNLGYYQLKAKPGLFSLSLAEGRARDLYTIRDTFNGESQIVVVKDFANHIRRFTVIKKRGRETESLLITADEERELQEQRKALANTENDDNINDNGGLWRSLKTSLFGGSSHDSGKVVKSNNKELKRRKLSNKDDGRIHVFSLATGQLYERLLRIMMLSVVKQSSRPVTFWLFENYLSPQFKETVMAMSREMNITASVNVRHSGASDSSVSESGESKPRASFEVNFVTYKWPQWLTPQTVQQRIIWGYKILFLDVLFPLDLDRVIYVDADQVVRTDLAELWDLDLEGKPYAYTPFCDSRKETVGFQFWRQGYWHDHLQGRPYHISALYVVDLKTFRRQAVGDSLRAVYNQLSRDPNSLANLDQDLPNYAQHQVPIYSLPQEWLWCESWCSDDSKAQAKTIDLCNNPLHKESKLDMAKRVISGPLFEQSWVELDEEIKAFIKSRGLGGSD